MKLAEYASKMNCQEVSLEFETATGIHAPKRTIHRFIHEAAQPLLNANKQYHSLQQEGASLISESTHV